MMVGLLICSLIPLHLRMAMDMAQQLSALHLRESEKDWNPWNRF